MAEAYEIPEEWYFITAPQDISWNKGSKTSDVQAYATNNPYLHYGATELRKLSLNSVMVEGFSDGMQVEQNIIDLEACMRVVLDTDDGYAAPFCWEVYANGKTYGTYIIESVSVKEQIRDNDGMAARANVDISLREVAPDQVNAGIDITAEAITGNLTPEAQEHLIKKDNEAKDQDKKVKKSKKDTSSSGGKDGGKGDSSGGKSTPGGREGDSTSKQW